MSWLREVWLIVRWPVVTLRREIIKRAEKAKKDKRDEDIRAVKPVEENKD